MDRQKTVHRGGEWRLIIGQRRVKGGDAVGTKKKQICVEQDQTEADVIFNFPKQPFSSLYKCFLWSQQQSSVVIYRRVQRRQRSVSSVLANTLQTQLKLWLATVRF